jgi:predicted ATPase
MLTRLEVDGFKSLRDFSIDLEPLTVLLGPNDAGKSNILEALALSSRLAHARGRAQARARPGARPVSARGYTSRFGDRERIDSGQLAPDASNLPSVLAWQSDEVLAEIRAQLAALIPGIADFSIIEQEEQYHIEFRARDGATIPARLASDGTLRMLALLTAVLARGGGSWNSIICVEEPENGIYPGRLRRLIDFLHDVTRPDPWIAGETAVLAPQILITTHSPVFLAALRQQPEALRYIDTVVRVHRLAASGASSGA